MSPILAGSSRYRVQAARSALFCHRTQATRLSRQLTPLSTSLENSLLVVIEPMSPILASSDKAHAIEYKPREAPTVVLEPKPPIEPANLPPMSPYRSITPSSSSREKRKLLLWSPSHRSSQPTCRHEPIPIDHAIEFKPRKATTVTAEATIERPAHAVLCKPRDPN